MISKQADGSFSFARSGERLKRALQAEPLRGRLNGSEDTSVFLDLGADESVVTGRTEEEQDASFDAQKAFGLLDNLMNCGHYDSPVRTTQELSKIAKDLFGTRSTGFALILVLRTTEDGRPVLSATYDDIVETASGLSLRAVASQFYLPPGNGLFPCGGVPQDCNDQGAMLSPPHMRFFVQGSAPTNEVNPSAHPWTTAVKDCTPSGVITELLTVGANAGKSVSMRFVAASAKDKERHDQPWGKSPALFFACNDRVLDLKPTTENLSAGLNECEKSKTSNQYRGWKQLKELCGDLQKGTKSHIKAGNMNKGNTIMKQSDLERYTSAQRRWLMGVGIIAIVRVDHLQLDPTKTRFSQNEERKEIKHAVFKEMIRWAQTAVPADLPYEVKEEVAASPKPASAQKGSGAAYGGGNKSAGLTPTAAAPGKAAAGAQGLSDKAMLLAKAKAAADAVERKGKRKVAEGDDSSDDDEGDGKLPPVHTGAAAKKIRETPAGGGIAAGSPRRAPLPCSMKAHTVGASAAGAPPETSLLRTGATTRATGAAAPVATKVAASVAPPRAGAGIVPLAATRSAAPGAPMALDVVDCIRDFMLANNLSNNSALQKLCTDLSQKLGQLDVDTKSELSLLRTELKKVRAESAEKVKEMRMDRDEKLAAVGSTPEQAAQKVEELKDLRARLAEAERRCDDALRLAEQRLQQLQLYN